MRPWWGDYRIIHVEYVALMCALLYMYHVYLSKGADCAVSELFSDYTT